jgi:hypothetical protein
MTAKQWLVIAASYALVDCRVPSEPAQAGLGVGPAHCLSAGSISGRHADGPNAILFETAGGVNYLNALAGECRSLNRLGASAAFVFESGTGGQLCQGDRVRIVDSRDANPARFQMAEICVLGGFIPVPR